MLNKLPIPLLPGMRRGGLRIVILQGLLLPSVLLAAAPHRHARTSHPVEGRAAAGERAPRAAESGIPGPMPRPSLRRAPAGRRATAVETRALRRARRKAASLQPTQPLTTALIDPVPRGRIPLLAPMKGSYDSLVRQNVRSEEDGLLRIQDDASLLSMRREGTLVAVPASSALAVDERLPANRRYCRPWTAQFLADLSRVHYGRFHRPLQVNSAVRTVEYQRHLERVNGNAAPADGDIASPHLTGATVDIAKKGLAMDEIGWMRAYLAPLQAAGRIDVEEEFYQACFHITVYRSYDAKARTLQANAPNKSAGLLAARLR